MDTLFFAVIMFLLGVVVAVSFYFLSYQADRKALADDRAEQDLLRRKR